MDQTSEALCLTVEAVEAITKYVHSDVSIISDQECMKETASHIQTILQNEDLLKDSLSVGLQTRPYSAYSFARWQRGQSRFQEARRLYDIALAGWEKPQYQNECALNQLYEMRFFYLQVGDLNQVEKIYKVRIKGVEKLLGSSHIATIETMSTLAQLYANQHRYEESREVFRELMDRMPGEFSYDTDEGTTTLELFARMCMIQGYYDGVESQYHNLMNVAARKLGHKHKRTLHYAHDLASFYAETKRYDESGNLLEELRASYLELKDDRGSKYILESLANTYEEHHKYEEAENSYKICIAGQIRINIWLRSP